MKNNQLEWIFFTLCDTMQLNMIAPKNEIVASKLNGGRETWISHVKWEGTDVTSGLGKIIESNGVFYPSNLKELVKKLEDGGASVKPLAQAALQLAHEPVDSELAFHYKLPPIGSI